MITYEELRESGRRPRVHGNGFLQLDLDDDGTRLHIWDDSLPRQSVATPIHDHSFDLRSTVLLGTLIHEELKPISVVVGEATHQVYRAQRTENENTILIPEEWPVVLETVQRLVLGAGSIYTFPAWKLHQTDYVGLTATLMEKTGFSSGVPRVLVPLGVEPDNEFDREGFDQEVLWQLIERVTERINHA